MNAITAVGFVCFTLTFAFTWLAYSSNTGAGQTARSAIFEAWFNILIGFSINFVANLLILPLVDAHITAAQNWWMGWIYTFISLIRQFAIRRWFNARLHSAAIRLAGHP